MNIIIPGFLDGFPGIAEMEGIPRFPALEKLLSRAIIEKGSNDYHETLFSFFDISSLANSTTTKTYPIAALNYLAETGDAYSGYLMHADPVHLRPEQDCLLLFDFEHLDLSSDDAETYINAFNQHFLEDGIELLKTQTKHWYLKVDAVPDLETSPLTDVLGHNIDHFLPTGVDAKKWRHLLNEIQMVFFSLAEDLPMVSSVWFHGGGELAPINAKSINDVSGDSLLLKGLAQHSGIAYNEDLIGADLMLIESLQRSVIDRDLDSWINELHQINALISNVSSTEFKVHACNGNVYHWQPINNWHFWKRSRPFKVILS